MIMTVIRRINEVLHKEVSPIPLVIFRIAFGSVMVIAQLRFLVLGRVKEYFIDPEFHFTYDGFSWIKPLSGDLMYGLVLLTILTAFLITIGFYTRLCAALFLFTFSYLELIDKTYYLNHYYLIILLSFLLIFVKSDSILSVNSSKEPKLIPFWQIIIIRVQIGVLYFFAGIAKIKPEWLFDAQPLTIWLRAKGNLPLIGALLEQPITAYFFSWSGMIYDLSIPFLLLYYRTRKVAYVSVILFHVMTHFLFNLGMFPWVMIGVTLVFFTSEELTKIFRLNNTITFTKLNHLKQSSWYVIIAFILFLHFTLQFFLPLRHHLIDGNVLWNQRGVRFAWHVMLMEKAGYCLYKVVDNNNGTTWEVTPSDYLSKHQDKQMSYQPDMIVQFAKFIKEDEFASLDVSIYVDTYVSLNNNSGRPIINNKIDLLKDYTLDELILQ